MLKNKIKSIREKIGSDDKTVLIEVKVSQNWPLIANYEHYAGTIRPESTK